MAQEHLNFKQTASSIFFLLAAGAAIYFLAGLSFEHAAPEMHSFLEYFWVAVCFGVFMYKGFRVFLLFAYKSSPLFIQIIVWQAMFISAVFRYFLVSKYQRDDMYINLHMLRRFYQDAFKQSRYAELDYDFFPYGEDEAEPLDESEKKKYEQQKRREQSQRKTYSVDPVMNACAVIDISLSDLDVSTLRTAYRKLAFKYHPDHNHPENLDTTAKMQEINEAYRLLMAYLHEKQ